MNQKASIVKYLLGAKSRRSSLQSLITLAILCWCSAARAQFQTETWLGSATGTATWTNKAAWSAQGVSSNGDALIFGSQAQALALPLFTNSANNFPTTVIKTGAGGYTNQFGIYSITFNTNGINVSGNALQITNGISDNYGQNSESIPLTLGVSQTFQNNSTLGNTTPLSGITTTNNFTNTESGTIALFTNTLTLGGSAPLFVSGAISAGTNGAGYVIVTDQGTANGVAPISGGFVRLSAANFFGTNLVVNTNIFIGAGTYNGTTNYYTNLFVDVGVYTNYFPVTNISNPTNGAYTTGPLLYFPLVQDAVSVNANAILQLGIATAIPTGAHVGNLYVEGELDLNGYSPTVNGLEDAGDNLGVIDNLAAGNNGNYVLTIGNANSNSVYSGTIQNTSGSVGVTKTGYGTNTFTGGNGYSGPTLINQGTLALSGSGTLGANSSTLTIASGAILDVSGIFGGYYPSTQAGVTVAAGTPTKPYTNFLNSYDTNLGSAFITTTISNYFLTYRTNTDLATYTNVLIISNQLANTFSSNTIVSIINDDVVGDFNVIGGGAISPITSVSPGIATWNISGNLNIDNSGLLGNNRVNFLLNNVTTTGGGTNDLIAVGGKLHIGDELDFVITPLSGTLAAGTYTLMTSSGYTGTGYNNGHTAFLNPVLERGLQGDTVQANGNNIQFTSLGGAAAPGSVIWSATNAAKANWDVALSQNWITNGPSLNAQGNNRDYFYPLDNVSFDDRGYGAVTLPVVVAPSSITFNNIKTNYTFTLSPSTFIAGPGGLTLNGSGSVTLQNPNSFTGDITVNAGTLNLGYYGSASPQYVIYNGVPAGSLHLGGGTINQNAQSATTPLAPFQNLYITPGASAITQTTRTASESARYSISNNVVRSVGGVLNIVPSNANGQGLYFWNTNSPDGTNDYGVNGILGGYATESAADWITATIGNIAVSYANYQGDNNPADWGSTSNVLLGVTSLTPTVINIASSVTNNSIRLTNSGPVVINISGGQHLTVSSGGILIPVAGLYFSAINGGTVLGNPGQDLIIHNANTVGGSFTIGSVIADNGGATGLTAAGGGVTVLTGNNTYTGPTYIENGYAGAAPGVLQIGNNSTSGTIASSSAVIDNGNLAFNRSDSVAVNGVISGFGGLTKLSAGALTLTANSTLSGQVTISAGTLQLGNGGAAGSFSNTVGVLDNATLVFDNNNTVSYPKPIGGYGNVVQFGSGNLVIATNEIYTGNTTVSNGTLTLTASGSISNTAVITVMSGALLDVSAAGGLTLRSSPPAEVLQGNGTINGQVTTTNGTTLDVLPGVSGFGTLTFNNALNLTGGSFKFDVSNTGSDLINVGGALAETSGNIVINKTGTLNPGVYKLIQETGTPTLTVGLVSSLGLAGVVQNGDVAVLTNDTTSSLSLMVYPGTITPLTWSGGNNNNAWDSITPNWNSGALDYANPDYATFDDTGSAAPAVNLAIAVSATGITNNANANNYVFGTSASGKITGGAELVQNGSSLLTLQTLNDYLGGTIIGNGTVQLGNNTSAAQDGMVGGVGAIVLNGTLVSSNFATETISGSISGTGQLVQDGVGKLILAGNNSGFSGGVSAATLLQMGNGFGGNTGGSLGTGSVTNNHGLIFDVGPTPSATIAVPGNITGSGSVTNIGLGLVQLGGTNTYAGNTVIDNGAIQLENSNAIPRTTALIMDDNNSPGSVGTLDLNGNNISVSSLQGNSTGNGNLTLVEGVILNNGSGVATLSIGGGSNTVFNAQLLDNNNLGTGQLALLVTNDTTLTLNACYNSQTVNSYPNLFSGGITLSNASLTIGSNTGTPPGNEGGASAGNGPIYLEGGLGTVTNFMTRMPTNSVLYSGGAAGSSSPSFNTVLVGPLIVPTGQFGTLFLPQRGTFSCTLQGGGTLIVEPNYVRGEQGGDWSAFTGTLIFESMVNTGSAGSAWSINSPNGYPNATLFMQVSNAAASVSISGANGGNFFRIGALTGGDNTSLIGGGTQGNGSSGGAANTIWAIGGLNLTTTNGSQFLDSGCGIQKVGSGQLVLTNSIMSYGGQTVVSNGTLTFAPLGNLTVAGVTSFIAQTNTFLVGSNFTIVNPGILDMSQASNTLWLGKNGFQTLYGNGTLNGNLVVTNLSLVAPGSHANETNIYTGSKLTVSGNMLVTNGTIRMSINSTTSPTYDSLAVGGTLTINSAALVVTNVGPASFPGGTSNVFRFFAGSVPVGASLGITNITLPALTAGERYVTNLVLDGSIALVNTNSALNAYPPNVQSVVSGNTLTLGWPTNLGWILQAQTNAGNVGLTPSTNWYDVSGTATQTNAVIPMDPKQPAVFYRMRNPTAPPE